MQLPDTPAIRRALLRDLQQRATRSLKVEGMLQCPPPLVLAIYVDRYPSPQAISVATRRLVTYVSGSHNFMCWTEQAGRALLQELVARQDRFVPPHARQRAQTEDAVSAVRFAGLHATCRRWLDEYTAPLHDNPCWCHTLSAEHDDTHLSLVQGSHTAMSPDPTDGFGPLTEADIPLILTHWPFGEPDSPEDQRYIRLCLRFKASLGWRKEGVLQSWAMTAMDRSLGMLHTLEEARGQGLGIRVMAGLCRLARARRWTPYLFTVDGNPAPQTMVERIGFTRDDEVQHWISVAPHTKQRDNT